jgi:NitT/TauT family transport system substrate-binding protein
MTDQRLGRAARRVAQTVTAGLVVSLVIASCGGSAGPPAADATKSAAASVAKVYKLTVLETSPGFFDIPLKIMIEEGLAKTYNLDLSLAQFQTGSGTTAQIFAGGSGDIMMGGIDAPAGLALSKTVDVQVIGTLLARGVWTLVSKTGSPYTSIQSLKGKVVGISGAGSFSDFALRDLLKKNNLATTDMQIAALGNAAAQFAALDGNKADAVQLQSPIFETALRDKKIQVVYDFRNDVTPALVFTSRAAATKADPTPYAAFMTAFRAAMDKLRADPAYALAMAKKYYGQSNSDPELQLILDTYLKTPGVWTADGVYTEAIHNAGKSLMITGDPKYTAANFPTFQDLTQYAPNSFKR